MAGRRLYDLMYRVWAPWDAVGVRAELRDLVGEGAVSPTTHPRAVDLGCGTGANVVYLSSLGFDVTGTDLSAVAIAKARARAAAAGSEVAGRCHLVRGDLTATSVPGVVGTFDLLIDFGTLDDLRGASRRAMADTVVRLSRPGSVFLFWCFYGAVEDLPRISFRGPSRLTPAVRPGEEQELFGAQFDIRPGPQVTTGLNAACFVMTRR